MDSSCEISHSNGFYEDAAKYWEAIPSTVNGMLGGFGFISKADIAGSDRFLRRIFELPHPPGKDYALDCGAGIGRITKCLLTKHFSKVDLVEQSEKFLHAAQVEYLKGCSSHIGQYYRIGLQEFTPEAKKYNVIWCQWVLGHLKDDDLVNFFKKCKAGLVDNGLIVVKENITSSNQLEIDTTDSSMTRPLDEWRTTFEKAELTCILQERQINMPDGLYPIHTFALIPTEAIKAS